MNSYEQKQAERKERQAERAERLAAEASAAFKRSSDILSVIPPGQPILVGHHSERRHRRDLERADNAMRKGVELHKAAEEAARRAESVSNAISSDDPDAPEKLRAKIAKLEAAQEMMTAANKVYRSKKLSDDDKVAQIVALGVSECAARDGLTPDYAGRIGFPSYALTNNNANIRRLKERVEAIERRTEEAPRADIEGDGWRISEDRDDNRLLITFDAIPDAALRGKLKQNGFKWSPTRGAWVRMLNNGSRLAAQWALGIDL